MTERLAERVLEELIALRVDDAAIDIALAAMEGDAALETHLAGSTTPTRPDPSPNPRQPVGAFLTAITVEGFRGIGKTVTLELPAGPGLTVITGRNGSGKSSFAEALEFALTRNTYRNKQDNSDFSAGWRNLHHPEPCSLG